MRRIVFLLVALISLTRVAPAAARPHYGGTLRVEMQSAPANLELPAISSPTEYWDTSRILSLVGDTLVTVDAEDRPHPALALAWQTDSAARHWQFTLRHGVRFHDGTPASAAVIAQILGALHPDWTVQPSADSVTTDFLIIDTDSPNPSLLAELALPRNLILSHTSGGLPIGTGPFHIIDFQPGKRLKLAAVEDCWSGRPFLDAVEVELGKSLRDQAVALELGRADLIEAAPQAANSSARLRTSLPVELFALVFPPNSRAQDPHLREALALSIDRKPIQSVLLKGAAEPTAALLPNWMTGYSAVFSTQPDIKRAKAFLADSQSALTANPLRLSYDPRDPQSQLIAERIALNAREAGITLQVSLAGAADIQLLRIALPTPDPALALREVARRLALPVFHGANVHDTSVGNTSIRDTNIPNTSIEDLYQAERTLLDNNAIIPLFFLPIASAAGNNVRDWAPDQLGHWNLPYLWLANEQPMLPLLFDPRASRPEESR